MARKIIFTFLLILLLYTRFLNLSWGLPYPFHPDERNMADSVVQLQCPLSISEIIVHPQDCLNPHFFAYGQFPLYTAYFGIHLFHAIIAAPISPISFSEAVIALRIIAALSSVILVIVLFRIICLLETKIWKSLARSSLALLLLIAVPVGIQSAHFGTTESLLMTMEVVIIYFCLLFLKDRIRFTSFLFWVSVITGLAVGTKISAGICIFPVLITFLFRKRWKAIVLYLLFSGIVFLLSSPHYILSYFDARSSLSYETAVATGSLMVFYTQQFFGSIPILFQLIRIFPYALGLPLFLFGMLGFIILPKNRLYLLLRIVFLIAFFSQAFLYAKWSRFMAPVFPILELFGILTGSHLFDEIRKRMKKFALLQIVTIGVLFLGTIYSLLYGFAYLHIYQSEDIRFTASRWVVNTIPTGEALLSETANVVDIPILPIAEKAPIRNYQCHSFDFYNLDESPLLQSSLSDVLRNTQYVLIPSRRVYANYTCSSIMNTDLGYAPNHCSLLSMTYPQLQEYYELIQNKSLYSQLAEFHRYPAIVIGGKTIVEFPDEQSEETWTVFDHPVIRVLQKK